MDKQPLIAVIGGGHAGCEAALAAARLGCHTVLFSLNLDGIAMMPCNPCIGGSAKGHLVREIDALGGEMGKAIDFSFLQSRMLNAAKGPAVYSLRAQADKARYTAYMKRMLESVPNLHLRQSEIAEIIVEDGCVSGVRLESGNLWPCDAAIVCSGTYLNARCLYGETVVHTGPNGQRAAGPLGDCLRSLGFPLMRFKTGTPARVHRRGLDFSKMEAQHGDENLVPFSFETNPEMIKREQIPCYLTYTTPETHEIIRKSIHRSPMYSGLISGAPTRYCPSIEDKVVRFADKERHPVFIEPEGGDTEEMYVQGMSSSLPEDVQLAVYRSIPGLENCEIMRNAYAIEYDCIDATQLKLTLEAKEIRGLFFAGQVCGSSGYEEAAAQGLVAGINAALMLRKPKNLAENTKIDEIRERGMFIDRAEGYIGVLIDDLVTKGTKEPYRMMTSRAEYRLLLRQDNADLRLTEKGYNAGLISEERYRTFLRKKEMIERERERVRNVNILPSETVNALLTEKNSAVLTTGCKLAELIKRPELSYQETSVIDPDRPEGEPGYFGQAIREQVNIQIKYEGYINMQMTQTAAFRKLENKKLPENLDYNAIKGLRLEARQKLSAQRPENVGQASRITGVSPADMNVLLVYLKARAAYIVGE
jgi:tRNA uridine 5-carboxymethylaminomethyl modification enzyme